MPQFATKPVSKVDFEFDENSRAITPVEQELKASAGSSGVTLGDRTPTPDAI